MMSLAIIHEALLRHLLAWTECPDNVFDDSVDTRPAPDVTYVKTRFAPQLSKPSWMGVPVRQTKEEGVLFLDVFVPMDRGRRAAEELADSLKLHFLPGQFIAHEGVRVFVERSQCAQAVRDAGHRQIPLTVSWRSAVSTST